MLKDFQFPNKDKTSRERTASKANVAPPRRIEWVQYWKAEHPNSINNFFIKDIKVWYVNTVMSDVEDWRQQKAWSERKNMENSPNWTKEEEGIATGGTLIVPVGWTDTDRHAHVE